MAVERARVIGRAVALLGFAVLVWRTPIAVHWYGEWQANRILDPSVAELYETNLWGELVLMIVGAGMLAIGVRHSS